MKRCNLCNIDYPDDRSFCTECGSRLTQVYNPPPAYNASPAYTPPPTYVSYPEKIGWFRKWGNIVFEIVGIFVILMSYSELYTSIPRYTPRYIAYIYGCLSGAGIMLALLGFKDCIFSRSCRTVKKVFSSIIFAGAVLFFIVSLDSA